MAKRAAEPLVAPVVDFAHDGRGVVKGEGKTAFVPDTIPGETVRYQPRRRRRSHDEGELLEVLEASPDRVTPRCPHFGVCGGCSLQHVAPARQLAAKQSQLEQNFQRIGGLSPQRWLEPLTGPLWGYRRRARLAVKWVHKKEELLVGFRERGKPYVTVMDSCEVLDPRVGSRIPELKALIKGMDARERIPQIEVAAGDQAVALVFRHLDPLSQADIDRLAAFEADSGLTVYLQPGGLDSVAPLRPPGARLSYALPGGDLNIEFTPIDFVQVNAELNRRMIGHALDLLEAGPGDTVLELFAGLGNFTLPLAASGAQVIAVEGEAGLVERGRANAQRQKLSADYHVADLFAEAAQSSAWLRADWNKLLLDPPRAGADAILPAALARRPERIVYVSCHPASLARDAKIIAAAGYVCAAAGVMDMFPHTGHVESIALFVPA